MDSMNGTQSSENESLKGDMSYLYGRDPSILAYGQRPFPSQESKKNLISLLEEENEDESIGNGTKISTISTDSTTIQTIKVFLRLKPFPSKMKITHEQLEAYSIPNSTTLLTKMPSLDNNTSCLKKIKTSDMICRKFIFTQTFGPETSQLELFEQAVKPQMVEFLAGKNSVIMSYGTTNSGKTYTLQGTAESPGIIPRGIEFVFSHINPQARPSYKPVNLCDVVYLNNHERHQETDLKMKLLSFNPADKNYYVNTYKRMQQLLYEESSMRPNYNHDAHYSVWISFAEIYNETIYDLLWNDCQKKRPALKLATDNRGRAFIKGLKSIYVNSGAEAYQVLMAGQYNLKVAATALNTRSSRSHCIFSIKLLKHRHEHDPHSVDVSVFAFCDLAGSERLKKTLNVGERLKEAQNINTSLLVLGRCLKTIYESQSSTKQKNESVGPFRESKLTRLFQRALSGKEQIALIVNVNPMPNLYVETQNVLNFSAIAKKIVIERTDIVKRRHSHSRFSRLVTQNIKTEMDWENTELEDMTEESEEVSEEGSDIEENDQEAYEDLLTENEMLQKEIKELKALAISRDMQTRQEMTDMYSEIMKKLESDWKNRLTDLEEQQEDLRELEIERIELFYKEKLRQLHLRKKTCESMCDEDEDDDPKLLEDLEVENTRLTTKIETMKKSMRDLKLLKENVEAEKTKISLELAVAKEEAKRANEMLLAAQKSINCGDNVSENYIDELNEMIKTKDERIKKMKTFLNEAKEEYIFITDQTQKMENQIKTQDELIIENREHIQDLEEQLSQANAYSSEQNKLIESLEDELDQQTKKLIVTEERLKSLSDQLNVLRNQDNDEKKMEQNEEVINEEFEKTKSLLDEMKFRFEFVEKENVELKEKLNQRVSEIYQLKDHLDSTKSQLDKVTEKANNLTIEDVQEDLAKHEKHIITEQGIKNADKISPIDSVKVTPDLANSSCQTIEIQTEDTSPIDSVKVTLNLANSSCQTIEIPPIATDEKCLQTSLSLNQSLNQEEEEIKAQMPKFEDFEELQKQCNEMKSILEFCKNEKENAERHFEEDTKNMQLQINLLSTEKQEMNEKISVIQQELEQIIKSSDNEKRDLQSLIEAQNSRGKNLEDQITKALSREQDKDKEISSLQKEMKKLIQSNEETVHKLEGEIKRVLKDLTTTKDQLIKSEEKNKKLDKEYKQIIHIFEMKLGNLEQKILEKQNESEKLKLKIEELKKSLNDTQHELEVFTRNRDETVSKYEDLVRSQSDEMDRKNKEITRLQELLQEVKENTVYPTPSKESTKKLRSNVREAKKQAQKLRTDMIDNMSEEEHYEEKLKTTEKERQKSKKEFLTPTKNNIPVIELSGSESKRSVKSATKEPVTSTRKTRKKRLFTPLDESYVDIDPSEPSPSPSSSTRSLRNRRR